MKHELSSDGEREVDLVDDVKEKESIINHEGGPPIVKPANRLEGRGESKEQRAGKKT